MHSRRMSHPLVAIIPMTLYINSVIANIESTKREVAGTVPVVALQKVVQYVQQHRGLSAAILI